MAKKKRTQARRRKTAPRRGPQSSMLMPLLCGGILAAAAFYVFDHKQGLVDPVRNELAVLAHTSDPPQAPRPSARPDGFATVQASRAAANPLQRDVPPAPIPVLAERQASLAPLLQAPKAPAGRFGLCGPDGEADCVIDGQTFRMTGAAIRLADIEAPGVAGAKCPQQEKLALAARLGLLRLLNAGTFAVSGAGPDEDAQGHKMRLIMRKGRSIGDEMIRAGLARHAGAPAISWCA